MKKMMTVTMVVTVMAAVLGGANRVQAGGPEEIELVK